MNLRKKTLLAIFLTFLALTGVVILVIEATLVNHIKENEEQGVLQSIKWVTASVEEVLNGMDRSAAYWASRPAIKQAFEDGQNKDLSCLTEEKTYTTLQLNYIFVTDPSGKLLFSKGFDWETLQPLSIPIPLTDLFLSGSQLLASPIPPYGQRGIYSLGQTPVLLASRPIILTNNKTAGYLVVGRVISENTIRHWQDNSKLVLSLEPYTQAGPYQDSSWETARATLQTEPTYIQVTGKDVIAGYTLLHDAEGKPTFILRTQTIRNSYYTTQMVFNYTLAFMVLAAIAFGGMTFFMFDRLIWKRLTQLSEQVAEIGISGNTSQRLSLKYKDELTSLGSNINRMLSNLELVKNQVQQSEEQVRQIIEQMPYPTVIFNPDGTVMKMNSAFITMHGLLNDEGISGCMNIFDLPFKKYEGLMEQIRKAFSGEMVYIPEINISTLGKMKSPHLAKPVNQYQELTFFPVRSGEEISRVVLITQDISTRKQHESEREVVYAVTSALRKASNKAEMLPTILSQLLSLLMAQSASILLLSPEGETICELGCGVWEEWSGLKIQKSQVSRQASATGQLYLNNNVLHTTHTRQFIEHQELSSAVSYPLITDDKVIGELCAGRKEGRFSDTDILILATVANIAASAIQRTTLFEKTQLRLKRLDTLHTIDAAITFNLDIGEIFEVLLDQVCSSFDIDAAQVLLYDPEKQRLVRAHCKGFTRRANPAYPTPLWDYRLDKIKESNKVAYISDLTIYHESYLPEPAREEGFVSYFSAPLVSKGELKGVLEIFHRSILEAENELTSFLETLAAQIALAIDNANLFQTLQRTNMELSMAYDTTLKGWGHALELRDRETEGHTLRVTDLTLRLARILGVSDPELQNIQRGAFLHDIGKMAIPDSILLKPGPLTNEERQIMQKHTEYAYELLHPIQFLRPALIIPKYHHERWDGGGYPEGLKGEQIPLAARIFAVVDVFDALSSNRPYRSAWPHEKVIQYIQDESGKHFDPKIATTFLAVIQSGSHNGAVQNSHNINNN